MSLGMLSGPGVLPLVSLFTHLSYISRVNCGRYLWFWGPLLSIMIPSCVCHGYFRIAHRHVLGGLWCRHSWGLVFGMMFVGCDIFHWLCLWVWLVLFLVESFMQSMKLSVVGWNIFLWIVLGLVLSRSSIFFDGILHVDRGLFGGNFVCFIFGRFSYVG